MENQDQQRKSILRCTRLISFNQTICFCSAVNQSTIAYVAGRSIVIENIRTLKQTIPWVAQTNHEIVTVTTYLMSKSSTKFAIAYKNKINNACQIAILTVSQDNYVYRKIHEKYMKISESIADKPLIEFDIKGQVLVVYTHEKNINYLTIYNCNTDTIILKKPLQHPIISIKSLSIKGQIHLALLSSFQLLILTTKGQQLKNQKKLHRYFLQKNEKIIQMEVNQMEANQSLCFVLTNIGYLIIFNIEECESCKFVKLDCKANNLNMILQCQKQNGTTTKLNQQQISSLLMPTCFQIYNDKIIISYEDTRKLLFITYNYPNSHPSSLFCTQNQIDLPEQNLHQPTPTNPKFKINQISVSKDFSTGVLLVADYYNSYYILVLDMLHCLTPNSTPTNPSHRLFTNFCCKGMINSVSYNQNQNTLFILHTNPKNQPTLTLYHLNHSPTITTQFPTKLQIWNHILKIPTNKIAIHPCTYTIMLLHDQSVKLHHYTKQKLLEFHVSFHLINCHSGVFSLYGDMIVLGNFLGIFVIDNYTYNIRNIISASQLLNKLPKYLSCTTGFDLLIQLSHGNSSYIAEINNYDKVKIIGQINLTANSMHCRLISDRSSCQLIDIDLERKIVIVVIADQCLQFYNNNMQILNTLSISATCINLCQQISVLMVGTSEGSILILKWPQIAYKTSPLTPNDPQLISSHPTTNSKTTSINLSLDKKLIIVVSSSCELAILSFTHQNSTKLDNKYRLTQKSKISNCTQYFLCETTHRDTFGEDAGNTISEMQMDNRQQYSSLRTQLQSNLNHKKNKITHLINSQHSTQNDIKSFMKKIETLKTQLTSIHHQKQQEINEIQQEFNCDVRNLYQERTQLQKEMEVLWEKMLEQKNYDIEQYRKQIESEQEENRKQIMQFQEKQEIGKITVEEITKESESQFYKTDQTKSKSPSLLQLQLDQQLHNLLHQKTNLQLSILTYTRQTPQLQNKRQILTIQSSKIQHDISIISKQIPERYQHAQEIRLILVQLQEKNQKLSQMIRDMEVCKDNQEKCIACSQHNYHQLCSDIEQINTKLTSLQKKKQQLDTKFCQQNQRKKCLTNSIDEAKKKIIQLRELKNKITQELIFKTKNYNKSSSQHKQNHPIKNKFKIYASSWKPPLTTTTFTKSQSRNKTPLNKYPQQRKTIHDEQSLQNMIQKRDILCYQVSKINKIKNDKIRNYKLFNQRIISDHKRLVLQFNQLKKFYLLLTNKQKKLQLQINHGCLNMQSEKIGILNCINKEKVKIRKSGFISISNGIININNQKIIKSNIQQEQNHL